MKLLEKDDSVISLKAELAIIQEEIIHLTQLEEKWMRLSEKTPYTKVERKKQILKQLTLIREALDEQRRQEHLLEKSLKVILEAIPSLKTSRKKYSTCSAILENRWYRSPRSSSTTMIISAMSPQKQIKR